MIKQLFILLGVGWLLGQLIRYFLRSKLAQLARQFNEAAMEQQRAQQRASKPKDAVVVDFVPKDFEQKRNKKVEGGEYVDYEEVKE